MSYMIVYDRVFIKTTNGYTLVVLHGDNNVWENNKKRARDWGCWMLESSDSEIRNHFNNWLGGEFQQHFKSNGKWIDDAGLTRWLDNGFKNAKTLDEICAAKPFERLHCYLSVRDSDIPYREKGHYYDEFNEYIKTTEDFEHWISRAKKRISNKKPSETIYVITSFSSNEPLRLGRNQPVFNGPVVARYKRTMFVSSCNDGRWTRACSDIKSAIVFESLEEAKRLIGKDLTHISFTAAKNLSDKNFVIKASRSGYSIGYITNVSKSGFRHSAYVDAAKKYTKTAAQRQIARLKERFGSDYVFEFGEIGFNA